MDLATDELKAKLLPAAQAVKDVERERSDRLKVRKRTKVASEASAAASTAPADSSAMDLESNAPQRSEGELGPEEEYRQKEIEKFAAVVDPGVKADVGASTTGLYELVGQCLSHLRPVLPLLRSACQLSLRTREPLQMPVTISVS